MATIRHSISIDASPDRIFPLVSSGHGFSQWGAADVSDDIPRNIVSLGFFNRATVYGLRPVRIITPTLAEWACQSGEEWNGTVLLFDLLPQKETRAPAAVFSHGLACRDGLLWCLHDYLGRTDVPIEGSRGSQDAGPTFLCHRNGVLMDATLRRRAL
jgi:hypothetical protein